MGEEMVGVEKMTGRKRGRETETETDSQNKGEYGLWVSVGEAQKKNEIY